MPDNTDDALSQAFEHTASDLDQVHPHRDPVEPLHVDDPGELIAAVPAMIGFVPERSLVVALLRDTGDPGRAPIIDAVLRLDLHLDDDTHPGPAADAYTDAVATICATVEATEVLAVIIDDRMTEPDQRTGGDTRWWAALLAAFTRSLAERDILVAGAWAVRAIAPAQPWWSLSGPNNDGTLPDPATSMVTLAHVLHGRAIRGARSELTDILTPDTDLAAQVATHLDQAVQDAHDRYVAAVRRGDPDSYHRRALERVLWQVADTDSALTARRYAELAAALRNRTVRDCLFALALGEHADSAEQLWVALAQGLSGCDRADAATLLAHSAYLRGDGPLTGIALHAALEADPTHSMAQLLEISLHTGMRPQTLRRLAHSGLSIATELGIDLGPIHR